MLALRKRKAKELSAAIGISEQNISLLRQGKVKGIRFETLDKICEFLDCDPGDILDRDPNPNPRTIGKKMGAVLALLAPLVSLIVDVGNNLGV
ncbi:helix-turn-helix transcriptional regulator [Erythrobacter sp.]|uniref:helix-turn-helix domain-containing protein n=1 Tax=Erythrobacter sp. TaxID=1042 RepID=UPI00311EE9B1